MTRSTLMAMEACQFSFRAFVHGEDERGLGAGCPRPNMRKPAALHPPLHLSPPDQRAIQLRRIAERALAASTT